MIKLSGIIAGENYTPEPMKLVGKYVVSKELQFHLDKGLSFRIDYDLLPSTSMVPSANGRRRHVFTNKASIMEAGKPLVIRPKNSERLVFESDGETVFMPKGMPVTVKRPGGSAATNQFNLAHSRFFSGHRFLSNTLNNAIICRKDIRNTVAFIPSDNLFKDIDSRKYLKWVQAYATYKGYKFTKNKDQHGRYFEITLVS